MKKAQATGKIVREMMVAAKMGGADPESNARLAAAVEKARKESVSREVIERAIKKGAGIGDEKLVMEHVVFEGYAPHKVPVIVEVYTPGGNWSSYPPHKHDIQKSDQAGKILEADLEEVYFYKLDRPEGFAFQRIYTASESPLHRAGFSIDAVLLARNNDAVLVPEGYHPVSSPPGYTTYYLNVLAGSAQSLANSEDPQHAWVKEHYKSLDARVPLYEVKSRV